MKKHLPSLSLRNILAGSIAALVSMAPSPAATLTWDTVSGDGAAITGGTGTWTDGLGNWNNGGDSLWSNANPDSAIFGGVLGTVSLGGPITVGGMTFNTAGYVIQGDTLTFAGATPTITTNADATIASLIAGTAGLSKAGAGNLLLTNTANTFSGGLTIGASAGTVTATTNNGTNASGLGTGAVSIGAGSTLNLLSANTVAAPTNINNAITGTGLLKLTFTDATATNTVLNNANGFTGTIQLSNTGANGDKLNLSGTQGTIGANVIVDSGSQLFQSGGQNTTFTGGISITGTGNNETRGAIRIGGVLGGNISLAGSSTIGTEGGILTGNISTTGVHTLTLGTSNSASRVFLIGVLGDGAGTLSLTKTQTSTAYLAGANTYTGATTISGGSIQLGIGQAGGATGSLSPSSAISVATGTSLIFNRSNAIAAGTDFGAISGAGGIAQNGPGTTTIGAIGGVTTMSYTGSTAVNRGALSLDFATMTTATNIIAPTSALSLGGGTLSALGKATGTTSQTFASTTLAPGASALALNRGAGTSTTVALGALTNAAGTYLNFQPNTAYTLGGTGTAGAASATEKVTVASVTRNGTAITIPASGFVYAGANLFVNTGTGLRYAAVQGAASGPYQIVAGAAGATFVTTGGSASTVYNVSAATTLTGATTNYAAFANSGSAFTLANGGFSYTTNGFLNLNAGTMTFNGAGSLVIGAEKEFVVNINSTGGLTVASVIANNAGGASSVSINGAGTGVTTFSGTNTYTGGTFLNRGTLAITTDLNVGAAPAAATPGSLTFSGGALSLTPTAAITIAANRGIQLNAGGGTITNTTAQIVTIPGITAGVGGITLNNTNAGGTLAITGLNTYTGGTTISGVGIVVPINNASPFGVGGTLTLNGGQMRATVSGTTTIPNPVSIAANTTFLSVATEKSLIFTGPAVLGGSFTLNSGVGSTVAATAVTFSGGLAESTVSNLTKAGTGELVLSGPSTYTGTTTVSAGRLSLGKNYSLYNNTPASWTAANITVASGATLALRVGGLNEFSSANVDTIAALGTATGGFQGGSALGLDTTSGNFTYGSVIANTNGGANALAVAKLGTNNLILSGANTYTGVTAIGGGVMVAANPAAFGPAGNAINFVTNLSLATAGNGLANGNIEFATDTTVNAYNFNGSSAFASSITLSRATSGAAFTHNLGSLAWGANILTVAAGANIASGTPGVSFANGMNLTSGNAATSTLNPTTATIAIGGPVNIGLNNQPKTLALDGFIDGNTISGNITNGLNALSLAKTNTSTWTLSGNNSYTGATTVTLGTLKAGSTTALSGASAFSVNGGTLDLDGFSNSIGSLAGTGGVVALGSGTLTMGANNAGTSYTGDITGAGGIVKVGLGAFTLPNPVSYNGPTAVNGGALLVNGTLASSVVTVASTGTLGGTGTIDNGVTVQSGGALSPATATTAGTITVGSLTLNAGSMLAYEFGGTNDLVAVSMANGLTINGGALTVYGAGGVTPLAANGLYTLFTYNTAFSGSLSNLTVVNSLPGTTYSVVDAGGSIVLTIGTATSADWSGTAGDGLWPTAGIGGNWNGAAAPNAVGSVANFGNFAGAPTTVTLNGGKTVGTILFDNANAFTIGTNADAITLDNGIAAGAISATTGSHTINAPIALNGPANITPGAGTSITFGAAISGTGRSLTFSGAGASTLNAANTYSGGTTLSAGTLNLANASAIGTGTLTIAGGTLDATAGALALSTDNVQAWSGNFTFTGTNDLDLGAGAVSFGSTRTVTVAANTLTVRGNLSGSNFGLSKQGSGTLALKGNNTYTGVTTVGSGSATAGGGGTLILSGTNTGVTGNMQVGNGATLQLQSASALGTTGVANSQLQLFNGSALQLRSDSTLTFNGTNTIGALNNATIGIDVNQLTGAGTNNVLTISPGTTPIGNAVTLNVTGGNGYSLAMGTIQNITGTATNLTVNPTTANVSLVGYNNFNNGANSSTLTLSGTTTGNSVTGVIGNQGTGSTGTTGTVAITKTGTSTWNLSGVNTYTGLTIVREGTLTLSGARTGTSGAITVSDTAGLNATLNITSGTYTIATQMNVGNAATTAATGTVNQTGGSVVFTASNALLIGQNTVANQGIYNLSGGSITTFASATRGIMLGVNPGTFGGTFNLSGTGVLNMTASSGGGGDALLQIGRSDTVAGGTTNAFNQTGGTANVGILTLGGSAAGSTGVSATLSLTGGTFSANQFTKLSAGDTNASVINIGGTADVTLPAFPIARGASSTATVNFDGGTLRPLAASTTYMGGLTNVFIEDGGVKFDVPAGKNITVTQNLLTHPTSTGGGLTKEGAGVLTLTGIETYTGATNVNGGTLIFGVSETLSALNIADGAVAVLGTTSPAPAPGEGEMAPFFAGGESFGAESIAEGGTSAVAAVPEPGSAALLFGGMLTLLGVRRRRSRK